MYICLHMETKRERERKIGKILNLAELPQSSKEIIQNFGIH